MKRVILTGAGGFIGRHCVRPLLDRGYEVHAVDRKPPEHVAEGVRWHTTDLLDIEAVRRLVQDVKPTHLLHLAWYVVPGKFVSAVENFDWVTASFDLVRQFVETGGQRVAVCGSGYEYDWNYGYCVEGLTPCVPDSVYGQSKLALLELMRSYATLQRVSYAWPRVFFLYGPREYPQRLVSSVILALLNGRPAPCSHGLQIRDYLHVEDVAGGLVAVLDSDVHGPVNVCSGQAVTLREIVLSIGREIGRPDLVQIGALPARANDVALVVGANDRLLGTGWLARYDLETGLRNTIDWWRSHLIEGGEKVHG